MRKKNISENVSKLTSLWFKRTRNFVAIRSEIKSTEWNQRYCPKSTIISKACNWETPVHNFKFFSSFESSIKTFDNIFGIFFLMNTVLLIFLIVCIQTGNVRNGWKIAVAKWTEFALGPCPKRRILWSLLDAFTIFKIFFGKRDV